MPTCVAFPDAALVLSRATGEPAAAGARDLRLVVTGSVTRAVLDSGDEGLDEPGLAGRLCRACVEGLDVDGAAVSLQTDSVSRVTLAATDAVAQVLEDLQFTLNQGACMDAARTGRPVLVADLRERALAARWPLFTPAVLETGVAAVFALPLQWGAVNLGVLDLYRVAPGRLADVQWRDAAAAADTATWMMMGRRTGVTGDDGTDPAERAGGGGDGWLDQVTGYRVEIYQAVGMVQVQLKLSGVDALARMRGHAFAHHQLLIDVAREVVARQLVFTDAMP